ncbi:hypothetical protein PIB30_072259 [Stylosanthes scabra]|uniref:Uncharacterized protein n=1 Tax=Stylosanthes scabra TaxID=79078 RepID=A0ABU6QR66_9FABA|nr:hypothetical protein [Stylosanthes scabra]
MLVQPSKLHKQLANSTELRAQPFSCARNEFSLHPGWSRHTIGACAAPVVRAQREGCPSTISAPYIAACMASKEKAPARAPSTRVHGGRVDHEWFGGATLHT